MEFSVFCSEHKPNKVRELLTKYNLDVVAGQMSGKRKKLRRIDIEGYKWFGRPHSKQNK